MRLAGILLFVQVVALGSAELITDTDFGPAEGRTGNIADAHDIAVLDDGKVIFASEAPDLDPAYSFDAPNTWDLFEQEVGGTIRAISKSQDFFFQGPQGQAAGVAVGGSRIFELRYQGFVPTPPHTVLLRSVDTPTSYEPLNLQARALRHPRIAGSGRFLVTGLEDTLLLPSDTNGVIDLLRYDFETQAAHIVTERNHPPAGHIPQGISRPDVSDDGAVIVFESGDNGFVPDDSTVNLKDVFVWVDNEIRRVNSRFTAGDDNLGLQTTPASFPRLDAAGTVVLFQCDDALIVPSDLNATTDIFRYRIDTEETVRVSLGANGEEIDGTSERPDLDSAGRFMVFRSNGANLPGANGLFQIYLKDLVSGAIELLSQTPGGEAADEDCDWPVISNSGRYVGFLSESDNLTGSATASRQLFRVDRGPAYLNQRPLAADLTVRCLPETTCDLPLAGTDHETTAAALRYQLQELPSAVIAIITDAQGIALTSTDTVILDTMLPLQITPAADFHGALRLRYVVTDEADSTSVPAIVTAIVTPNSPVTVQLASTADRSLGASDGEPPGNASSASSDDTIGISSDGSLVVFASEATNLTQNKNRGLLLRDLEARTTVSLDALPSEVEMSSDGSSIAYIIGQQILHQHQVGGRWVTAALTAASTFPDRLAISGDGERVLFVTEDNLIAADQDVLQDVYLWEPSMETVTLVSDRFDTAQTVDAHAHNPALSADGNWIAFSSEANLAGDSALPNAVIWLRYLDSEDWEIVGVAGEDARAPALSQSGRYLSFQAGTETRVADMANNVVTTRTLGNTAVTGPLSASGRFLMVRSTGSEYPLEEATLPPQTDASLQAWRFNWRANSAMPASFSGIQYADADVTASTLSANGRYCAWASTTSGFGSLLNGRRQVFHTDLGESPNALPQIQQLSLNTPEETALTVTLTATDPDADDLLVEIIGPPLTGSLSQFNSRRRPDHPQTTVLYQPPLDFAGSVTLTWQASDGIATVTSAVTIQVLNVNDPPSLGEIGQQEVAEGQLLSVPLMLTDPDLANIPPDTHTYTVTTGPGQVLNGTYIYTPDHTVVTETGGQRLLDVTVEVRDSHNIPATTSFFVQVTDVNSAPQATNVTLLPQSDALFVTSDLTFSYEYLDSDGDSENATGAVEWFTRATANDGFELWSGTTIIEGRTHTLPAGTALRDSEWFVRVTPTDTRTGADALSGTPVESPVRTVQNTIPPALDLTVTVLEDSQTTITLNTADPDPGDTPEIRVNIPAYGKLISSSSSATEVSLRYTPNSNFFGEDSFVYSARDDRAQQAGIVTIQVIAQPDPPVTSPITVVLDAPATSATFTVTATDPDEPAGITESLYTFSLLSTLTSSVLRDETGTAYTESGFTLDLLPGAIHSLAAEFNDQLVRYRITDADGQFSEADLRIVVGAVRPTFEVQPGWNLLTGSHNSPDTISQTFGTIAFPTGYAMSQGELTSTTALTAGAGTWVFCTSEAIVPYIAAPTPSSAPALESGWNLAGTIGDGPYAPPFIAWAWDPIHRAFRRVESLGTNEAAWIWTP